MNLVTWMQWRMGLCGWVMDGTMVPLIPWNSDFTMKILMMTYIRKGTSRPWRPFLLRAHPALPALSFPRLPCGLSCPCSGGSRWGPRSPWRREVCTW